MSVIAWVNKFFNHSCKKSGTKHCSFLEAFLICEVVENIYRREYIVYVFLYVNL